MRLVSLLLLLSVFTSCGVQLNKKHTQSLEGSRQYATSDKVFDSYTTLFVEEAKKNGKDQNFNIDDIPINFGDTTKDVFDGVCNTYSDGTKEIFIKKSWWINTSETQREVMIFHELGHCKLERDHDDDKEELNGYYFKFSIMSPTIPTSQNYSGARDAYLEELFKSDKGPIYAAFASRAN